MRFTDCGTRVSNREMERSSGLEELHLFDDDAREERALCGAGSSAEERMGVVYYLECRRGAAPVGTVCEECKALAAPFAESVADALETDGLADEAAESRRLAGTLRRETAP